MTDLMLGGMSFLAVAGWTGEPVPAQMTLAPTPGQGAMVRHAAQAVECFLGEDGPTPLSLRHEPS